MLDSHDISFIFGDIFTTFQVFFIIKKRKKKDLLIVKYDNMLARYLGCNKVFMDSVILDFHVSASIVSFPLLDVYKQTFSFSLDHVIQ